MKKSSKQWLIIAALGFASMGSVWADGGHWHGGHDHSHIGIGIGIGPWAPWYYPPPTYYYPYYPRTVVIEQPAPPVYIEQSPPEAQQNSQPNYWYYCAKLKAYYPYVKDCPAGWQRVIPQPPQ